MMRSEFISAEDTSGATPILGAPMPGLVWAFRIHPDGSAEALPLEQPVTLSHDGVLWLHFNLADMRAVHWLEAGFLPIAPQALRLLLAKDDYQQLHATHDGIYGVVSDLLRGVNEDTDQVGYLRFALTERLMVSGRHHALCAVDATRRALEEGHRIENPAALLETIIEGVAETVDGLAARVGRSLDEIEDRILSGDATDMRQKLGRLRRTCARLHRKLSGMRIVFQRLEHDDHHHLPPTLRLRAGKLIQRLDGLDHSVVEMRERSRLLQEELHLKIEEQANHNLRLLSILTSLLLPPTLITGIFGMNVKGVPLGETDTGFIWAMVLLAASSAVAYGLLRRFRLI